jgi:hypothetical protein
LLRLVTGNYRHPGEGLASEKAQKIENIPAPAKRVYLNGLLELSGPAVGHTHGEKR